MHFVYSLSPMLICFLLNTSSTNKVQHKRNFNDPKSPEIQASPGSCSSTPNKSIVLPMQRALFLRCASEI
ncbi:hypothetical protein C1H46_007036 [Malus baccata]|uniref:Secreted protein n=1 Tax=Malus baccata TaxID=106549 RepID=A0A540N9Y7_MALBA|nr:hypothetical protein C1H46_007036 [Malus baccata]